MIFFILLFHPHLLPMEQPLSLCMKTQKGTIYSGLSVLETISDLTSQAQRTADDLCDMTMIPAAAWTSQPILSRHDFDGIPNLGGVASQPSNRGPPTLISLEYDRLDAPNNAVDDLLVDSYGNLSRRADIPGQAHHLNQTAAYCDVIPTRQGASIKLEGNILTDAGAPHTRAHQSLETFWNQYRGTDIVPTNLEYTRALQQSLRAAGLPEAQVQQAVRAAIRERVNAGLLGGLEVPRVPRKIRNLAQ